MKITHYTNSFLHVQVAGKSLVCDPWVGTGAQIAWVSHPILTGGIEILNKISPDAIYISHLHPDHFDKDLLRNFEKKDIPICILSFADGRLKRQIEELGYTKILECKPWETYTLMEAIDITVVPADSTNSRDLPDFIDYELDTSLLVRSNDSGCIFYNNVDSPMTLNGFSAVREFARKKYASPISCACIAVGASCEYPQCFIGIDRSAEQERLIRESLECVRQQLKALQPEAFFPAGGSYAIYGKYHSLNRFIAQPSHERLRGVVEGALGGCYFELEGGKSLELGRGKYQVEDEFSGEKSATLNDTIRETAAWRYPYCDDMFNTADLRDLFERAKSHYFVCMQRKSVPLNFEVEFFLYDDLRLDGEGTIAGGSLLMAPLTLHHDKPAPPIQKLECHLDVSLFRKLLCREYVWNAPLSGSLMFFRRFPNAFIPTIPASLNYLRV